MVNFFFRSCGEPHSVGWGRCRLRYLIDSASTRISVLTAHGGFHLFFVCFFLVSFVLFFLTGGAVVAADEPGQRHVGHGLRGASPKDGRQPVLHHHLHGLCLFLFLS